MHDDLLDIAELLAQREVRRPRQVSLRRAVSSAYYALFHRLAALCADELVGWSRGWDVFTPVYRSLDHAAAAKTFRRDREGRVLGGEVAAIGAAFVLLQEARHAADYDPEPFPYGRRETLDLIEQARQAIVGVGALDRDTKLRLAVQLVTRPRQLSTMR